MRKFVVTTLIFVFCLSAFCGCNQTNNDTTRFDFSYSVEKTEYARGETVLITAEVTNVSGKTYKYKGVSSYDFYPAISLYQIIDEQKYEIPFEPYAVPAEAATKNKKIKDGESGSWIYKFIIPEEAPLGDYSITLLKVNYEKEFVNIFSVAESPKEVSQTIMGSKHVSFDGQDYILVLPISRNELRVSNEYVSHLPLVNDELLESAERKLTSSVSAYNDDFAFDLQIDQSGNLCLYVELIVAIDPPKTVMDENGDIIGGGCGIDHEHKFFSENISLPNFSKAEDNPATENPS